MVQKEVRKKTTVYATAAILMAVILISMVYTFGSTPTNLPASPPTGQTPVNSSPGPGPTIIPISHSPSTWGMKTFSSAEELKSYLINNTQNSNAYGGATLGIESLAPVPAAQSSPNLYWTRSTEDYSTTNIQVAGVDEADTVKTDGKYIYTISNSQNNGVYYYGFPHTR